MSAGDSTFAGSIPALYDRHLGPWLFAPYAEHVARNLAQLASGRLLEVAAGTGIVTEALARHLAPAVEIVATDLNQAMLDHAATKPGLKRVTLRQADALALPFDDASFDVVISNGVVDLIPDKDAVFSEITRVLRPGGRIQLADVTIQNPVSEESKRDIDLWAG